MSSGNVVPKLVEEVELLIVDPNSSKMNLNSNDINNRINRDSEVNSTKEETQVINPYRSEKYLYDIEVETHYVRKNKQHS